MDNRQRDMRRMEQHQKEPVQNPYPPIETESKNTRYARAMLSNMGGQNSEMTAVGMYFYNHLVTHPNLKEISEVYHKISMEEMRHLEIFGQLAVQLGADPRLWEHQRGYWTPNYISYQQDVKIILKTSISSELNTITKYEKQIKIIEDRNIKAILLRIIEDEQKHVKLFEELLARV